MGGGGGAEGRDLKVSRKFLGTQKMQFLKRKLLLSLDTIVMANKLAVWQAKILKLKLLINEDLCDVVVHKCTTNVLSWRAQVARSNNKPWRDLRSHPKKLHVLRLDVDSRGDSFIWLFIVSFK